MLQAQQLPNMLTLLRVMIIPLLVASFYLEERLYHWVAAVLFLIASITDFFDGYLARLLQAQTKFGKVMDNIADKLLVIAAILMLLHFGHLGKYGIFPAIAIICREIIVSGTREFLASINAPEMPSTMLAKIKTGFQMTAIVLLLLGVEGPNIIEVEEIVQITLTELVGRVLFWFAAGLTLITGYRYVTSALKYIR